MIRVFLAGAALLAVAVAGCSESPALVDAAQLEVPKWTTGTIWTFVSEAGQRHTMTVVGIEPHRDFEAYHIHLELGEPDESGIAEYDYWYDVQSLRLLGASLGGDRIESQCDGGPLFPFVEATYRCETRLDGSLVESKTKTYVIDGWEEEVVPAGRFPSVRFHEVDAEDPSIVLQSGAYSPKTGFLVRHASQGSEEFLLESWTPGP